MDITKSIVSERDRALLGGDYSSYHAQATRRLHTIRKKLGATTPKGRKYSPRSAVTAQDIAKNSLWVPLLLTSAERAWADAMHMKTSQSPENTQKPLPGPTKRQIVSRYRRAILYASNLVECLQDQTTTNASSQDLLEAKAYLALLKGGLDFERNKWSSCIQNYSFTRLVYTAVAKSSQADTFSDLLEGTVDPSIRYAAYQERMPRTKAVSDIAIENFPTSETDARQHIADADITAFETTTEKAAAQAQGQGDLPTTIEWRGRAVKLEDASISQALASAKQKEDALHQTFTSFKAGNTTARDLAGAYDEIINARQDAADATKSAIDELVAEGVDQSDSRVQGLQITRTAVNYGVIEWRVGRNRVLCGDQDGLSTESGPPKPNQKSRKDGQTRTPKEESNGRKLARLREKVALYDSILQNLDAVKQLPGVIADTSFVSELAAKRSYFRALKCVAIGRSQAIHGNVANALALFSKAQELSQQAQIPTTNPSEIPRLDLSQSQIDNFESKLTSLNLQYRALADLNKNTASQQQRTQQKTYKTPLLERLYLEQYDDNIDLQNIANYPPKMRPIPMQPMFLDLAWDYIQYPGHASASEATTDTSPVPGESKTEEAPKKRGWFGFGR